MDFLADPVLLARIQFALTAMYHFIFVPLSIGLGLIVAIFETKYYRSQKPEDAAASRFWIKVFTATFALGVATGITMEFSFGTNWADYARFVGDIFGAPLAAEALLAFFLESVFLGVLLFGRKKVGKKFYLASAWLVSVWFLPFCIVDYHCKLLDANPRRCRTFCRRNPGYFDRLYGSRLQRHHHPPLFTYG